MSTLGTVDFWNARKGFGFISGEDGKSYFVHQSGLEDSVSALCMGDSVRFAVEEGSRGPKAAKVATTPEEREEENTEGSTAAQFYEAAIQGLCRGFAESIAENPEFLMNLEWRELEKVLAFVLESLGFDVTLTPVAKDGGKDIIAELEQGANRRVFYIELKHWTCGKRVGLGPIEHFIEIIAKDGVDRGVLLSTSGYTEGALIALSVLERPNLQLGGRPDVWTLCRTYTRARTGIWSAPDDLSDVLFRPSSEASDGLISDSDLP